MNLTIVIGVLGVMFFLSWLAFKLDEEHEFLKTMFIIFALGLLFIVPSAIFDDCEFLVNETATYYKYGNNFTLPNGSANYHWDYDGVSVPNKVDENIILFHEYTDITYDEYCHEVSGSNAFIKAGKIIYYTFVAYLIVYLFYKSSLYMALVNGKRRKRGGL